MKAVLFCTDSSSDFSPFDKMYPSALLPLVDRPFVQHVVEVVAEEDLTELDFVLSHLPEKLEEHLGDGSRWGCEFVFHLVKDVAVSYEALSRVKAAADEFFLIGHASRFPIEAPIKINQPADPSTSVVAFMLPGEMGGSDGEWSGWAWVRGDLFGTLSQCESFAKFDQRIRELAVEGGRSVDAGRVLSIATPSEMMACQARVLSGGFKELSLTGREQSEGIRVGRNVRIHPSAELIPPIFVGENSRVGKGVVIGPNVTVMRNCVIDRETSLEDSVVLPGSYIGRDLELKDVMVQGGSFVNFRIKGGVQISDQFILGNLERLEVGDRLRSKVTRLLGLLLLVLTLPVTLLVALSLQAFRKGPVFGFRQVLRPARGTDVHRMVTFTLWTFSTGNSLRHNRWKHLLLDFLPGLVNVVKGDLAFVGPHPRTKQGFEKVSEYWQDLYTRCMPGLISEAQILYGSEASDEERFAAEAMYSVTGGTWHDLKLVGAYISQLVVPRKVGA